MHVQSLQSQPQRVIVVQQPSSSGSGQMQYATAPPPSFQQGGYQSVYQDPVQSGGSYWVQAPDPNTGSVRMVQVIQGQPPPPQPQTQTRQVYLQWAQPQGPQQVQQMQAPLPPGFVQLAPPPPPGWR